MCGCGRGLIVVEGRVTTYRSSTQISINLLFSPINFGIEPLCVAVTSHSPRMQDNILELVFVAEGSRIRSVMIVGFGGNG